MDIKNVKTIQSVSRAISILQCFEDYAELGVTEISKIKGLHKRTTIGLISTLEANNLLEKCEDNNKYRLGIELFRLGTKVNTNLRKVAVPYLEKLVEMYQETVNLIILDDLSVVYLEKIESPHSMRISTLVGGRLPLYCTAVGKSILSTLSQDELHEKIDRMEFAKFTDKTTCDKESLLKYLEYIKNSGYAEDSEELEIGLSCVAAPIFNHLGKAFAAISISGPTSRMKDYFCKETSISLIKFTQEISIKMGYIPPKF